MKLRDLSDSVVASSFEQKTNHEFTEDTEWIGVKTR